MDTLLGFILLAFSLYGAKNCIDRFIGVIVHHKAQKRKNLDTFKND